MEKQSFECIEKKKQICNLVKFVLKKYNFLAKTVNEALKDLHNSSIITSIDKAMDNVALTCKRFYILTSFRELAITNF